MNWETTRCGPRVQPAAVGDTGPGMADQAGAQTKPPPIPAYFNLIERLNALSELLDGVWKVQAGDIAHGENAGLDNSGWPSLAWTGSRPRPLRSRASGFARHYAVPKTVGGYDMTGARVWFHFSRDRQIVYSTAGASPWAKISNPSCVQQRQAG